MSDERALIRALKRGEERAFAALVDAYTAKLFSIAYRILRDVPDAEDAVQEAFARAFRAMYRFREGAALGPWLRRIASNAAIDQVRKRARRRELAAQGFRTRQSGTRLVPRQYERDEARSDLDSPERALELSEIRETLSACIRSLPAIHRQVLELCDIRELDRQLAAETLGVSRGCVKLRLHRARRALRARLLDTSPLRTIRRAGA